MNLHVITYVAFVCSNITTIFAVVNQALFDYISNELTQKEDLYVINTPSDVLHSFNVSFVFPKMAYKNAFSDPSSDERYCFANKMIRKVKTAFFSKKLVLGCPEN